MEDSSLLQNLTLNPSEDAFSFPPHRRRPLRSRTYRALIGILSHCHTNSPQLQMQEEVDAGDFELRPLSEENGSITSHEVNLKAVLVPLPDSKQSEDTLVKETTSGENKENINFQEGGFDYNQATVPKLDGINKVTDGEQEVAPENSSSIGDVLMVNNQMGDCAIQIAKEQVNADIVLDNQMDDFGTLEELKVDNEFSIHDYSEVLDSCFVMDMVIESSKTVEDSQENGIVLEENRPKEAEHELQLKEMELEKLIHSSGAVDSSCCLNADEEMEEGEISGEAGVVDASFDVLYEDAASLGEKTTEMVHASEYSFDKEELICNDEDRGCLQHQISDPTPNNIVNKSRTTAVLMQDCHSQNVFRDSHVENQRSGPVAPFFENLSILQENAAENQMSASFEKDGDARKKKRKNGPLTKERRAKKKGEKCKFSHDTVPLTKSKPCGHFARHSCMKGDDCPFDHQLSKYPCNNYTSNGFCSRGSDCLFSHELPAKQSDTTLNASKPELTSAQHTLPDKGGSFMISKVTKPEVNSPSPLNNSNYSKHMDNRGIFHQKVDSKLCSAGNSSDKSAELLAARTVPRTARQAPKGISFFSNKDTTKHERDGSTNDVDVGCKTILNTSNLNEMSETVAPRKPRGINFLSFARPSTDDSSSKMFSNLLSSSNNETRKSVMGDMGEGKLICSLPESSGLLKVNREINQNATNLVRDLNEKVHGTLLTVPQHVKSLSSFEKAHLDDSIFTERANFHIKKDDTALSFVKERQSTGSNVHDTIKIFKPVSFGGPSDQLTGGRADLSSSSKTSFLSNTPSSVQKAVQSTLAFAANFEPDIKVAPSFHQREARSSQVRSVMP
ncbi:hypothetical protein DH2020_018608 [Rehmannia glutinosa]|uniref:C3H1-type domain-containing protein n=1 Tax=Rehmannia glutinosa TaxID=99300 RepID=A0ABR0WJD8_REHGL